MTQKKVSRTYLPSHSQKKTNAHEFVTLGRGESLFFEVGGFPTNTLQVITLHIGAKLMQSDVFMDGFYRFRWSIIDQLGQTVAVSRESYLKKGDCLKAIPLLEDFDLKSLPKD